MKIDLDNYQEIERDEAFDYSPRPKRRYRRRKRFLKICLFSGLFLAAILFVCYLTLRFFIGPIVKTVDSLPNDFPSELSLYQVDQAKIDLQDSQSREKLIAGLKAMPDWVLTLFVGALSDDVKAKLSQNFGDNVNIPKNFSADEIKEALKTVNLDQAKTVDLSWDFVGKTKEEIAAYYKQKLAEADFEFKENLADYEINLGFWKDGVFGTMTFADQKENKGQAEYGSQVEMTVNYFKK